MIAVTGVGGGVGQSIIKCLAGSEYRAVAIDPDPLAAGLYLAPAAYLGPTADAPEYVEEILRICDSERCGLLFPGVEPELPVLAAHAARIREAGVVAVVSEPDVVRICDDKLATAEFLARHGFDAPNTTAFVEDLDASWFPCVLKPRWGGARSQCTFVVHDKAALETARAQIDPANCIVQEYVEGDEYTCGTVSLDGTCRGVIVMRRTLRAGDTYKAFVTRDTAIETHVGAVVDALGPFGACNVQLRLRAGRPYVFEINARCSGTTYARALAGFNEPRMIADYLVRGIAPAFDIREIAVLRYWNELVVETPDLDEITTTRRRRAAPDGP